MSHHFYIAHRHCGCITAAVFDDPVSQEETAIDVADFIRSGRYVERIAAETFDLRVLGCTVGEAMTRGLC